jgi:hypothetical protein
MVVGISVKRLPDGDYHILARTSTSYPELRQEACCTRAVGKSRIALLGPKPCVVTPHSVGSLSHESARNR